jgi:hypothetical protein
LMGFEESNLEAKAFLSAFTKALRSWVGLTAATCGLTFAGPPVRVVPSLSQTPTCRISDLHLGQVGK